MGLAGRKRSKPMNDNIISQFGLTQEQMSLLFSLQYKIIDDQVKHETNDDKKKKKQAWEYRWLHQTSIYLKEVLKSPYTVMTDFLIAAGFYVHINNENKSKTWKYLILLECCLYEPFYSLGSSEEDKKMAKGIKKNKDCFNKSLTEIAKLLEIDVKYVEIFKKKYRSAIKRLSNYYSKMAWTISGAAVITALAAIFFQPAIVAILAKEGLTGAAASASVMAMLGGGTIAAGGFGMVGGWAVLVGGGFLLGGGMGTGAFFSIASKAPDFILSQAARLEVVLKEIIMGMQNDVKTFQEILLKQQEQIINMKLELNRLQQDQKKHKEEIKNLKKSIAYLEKLCKIK